MYHVMSNQRSASFRQGDEFDELSPFSHFYKCMQRYPRSIKNINVFASRVCSPHKKKDAMFQNGDGKNTPPKKVDQFGLKKML